MGRVVVDGTDDLDRLCALAAGRAVAQPVLLRVTPGVEAHTHEFVRTGQEDTKFGVSIASGAAGEAIRRLAATDGLVLVGLHAHVGSQVFDVGSLAQAAAILGEFFAPLGLEELCVGGGLGVPYVDGEARPDDHRVGARGARSRHVNGRGLASAPDGRARSRDRRGRGRHPVHGRRDQESCRDCGPTWRSTGE